eukprot:m.98157 g.98157  ORF g.98157 m.98157 type:complete len:391 (-) comp9002_c0_seq1:62-1234(-)
MKINLSFLSLSLFSSFPENCILLARIISMSDTCGNCCSMYNDGACPKGMASFLCKPLKWIGKPLCSTLCFLSRPVVTTLNHFFPSIVKKHSHIGCFVGVGLLGLACYTLYRHLFTSPGFNPPTPGDLYLAHGCRKRFELACDMEQDPYVFDVSNEAWSGILSENWETIRDELQAYLDQHDGKLAPFGHTHRMSSKSCWRVLSLRLWGVTSPDASNHFGKTMDIVREAFSASDDEARAVGVTFSQLEPNSDIAPHYGDTNGNYRAHLGLIVPASLPDAGMEIGTEQQGWGEGKLFAFNDAHFHKAWNHCSGRRFILIVDVMRRKFMDRRKHLCRYVMASFLLQRVANFKYFGFVKATKWMEFYAHSLFYCCLYLPINFGIGNGFVHWFMKS